MCTQRILLRGGGGILPNFFMRTWKGGLYSNFWCVMKEYYCECGGGGAYARFFMRTEKLLGRGGGGLYPNFWCVLKEYYCECGGGGLMPDFFVRTTKKY